MKELKILKNLIADVNHLKGILKIDDTYINSIEKRINDYLIKYGELPPVEFKYGYLEGKGIIMFDIKVHDNMVNPFTQKSN